MKQVDNFFREKLIDHESEVSLDMWGRISQQLEEKKDYRPLLWFISLLGALAIIGALWFLIGDKGEVTTEHQDAISQSIEVDTKAETKTLDHLESIIPSTVIESNNVQLADKESTQNIVKKIEKTTVSQKTQHSKISKTHDLVNTNVSKINTRVRNIPSELNDIKSPKKDVKLIVTKSIYDGLSNENITTTTINETKRSSDDTHSAVLSFEHFFNQDHQPVGLNLIRMHNENSSLFDTQLLRESPRQNNYMEGKEFRLLLHKGAKSLMVTQ